MAEKPPPNYPMYCPRCDRKFDSHKSPDASLAMVSDHVDKAHPDMDNYIKDDD